MMRLGFIISYCATGADKIVRTVKSQRRTRGTFMSALSNESFSHYRCVEVTLPFSAVAQRLL